MRDIIFRDNFPNSGEAYKVGEVDGRYFFAWGHIYPFAEEVPDEDISDGSSGIEWFGTEEKALHAYLDTVEAAYDTFGAPAEKVMTASEAEERWGIDDVRQACTRGRLKKYIESGHVRKSGRVWLVSEYAMRDAYGEPKK